jgi:hypothetical protein
MYVNTPLVGYVLFSFTVRIVTLLFTFLKTANVHGADESVTKR